MRNEFGMLALICYFVMLNGFSIIIVIAGR